MSLSQLALKMRQIGRDGQPYTRSTDLALAVPAKSAYLKNEWVLRRSLVFVLPLGLLLTGCAPSDPSAAPSANEERPIRVAGAAGDARGETRTASPASSRSVVGTETNERTGREHVVQAVMRETRPVGSAVSTETGRLSHDVRSRVAVQTTPSATSTRTRLPEGGTSTESGLPLRGSAGVRANTTAALGVGAPVVASAREQAPPVPLAVVAAAYPQSFTPEQMRALVQLGESFLTETSPMSPNAVTAVVASPDLTPAERWAMSAEASDERFKAMFGYQAFNAMQLQRAREAYAETKAK
jgi:hypothetical protein